MIEIIGKKIVFDNNYEIREYHTDSGLVRAFLSDDCIQSLTYMDKDKKNDLCYKYFKLYDLPVEINPNGSRYLVLGGGTLSYPKYFISKNSNRSMTVIEKDPFCIDVSKKYFYLDDVISEFDPDCQRLNIVISDALSYVKKCQDTYDYILIDLFDGNKILTEAYTILFLNDLKRILSLNGIVIANYIVSGHNMNYYKRDLETFSKAFKHFKIITTKENFDTKHCIGNLLLIGSNTKIVLPKIYDIKDIITLIMK